MVECLAPVHVVCIVVREESVKVLCRDRTVGRSGEVSPEVTIGHVSGADPGGG